MNNIREIEKINQEELDRGIAGTSASWHSQFTNCPWCFVGNIDHGLSEGDLLCIMSQFGDIEDIHLVRDKETGKPRGFGFIKYDDSRSCILAVDNLNGVSLLGRSLRVDHIELYRLPKKLQEEEEEKKEASSQADKDAVIDNCTAGHAYKGMDFENKYNIHEGMDLFAAPPPLPSQISEQNKSRDKRMRKEQREKQRREKEQRRKRREEKREKNENKKRQKRARKHHRHTE